MYIASMFNDMRDSKKLIDDTFFGGGKLQAITQEFADSCMKTAEESYLDSIA